MLWRENARAARAEEVDRRIHWRSQTAADMEPRYVKMQQVSFRSWIEKTPGQYLESFT